MIHILNGDTDEREARLSELNRPMPDDARREKLKRLADDVARESGINALEDHAERERLDGAWADQRREAMRARYAAEQDAREQGEDLPLLGPPPVQRPAGWRPEGQNVEPTTQTYNLTGAELQKLFGRTPPDDPETLPATVDLGALLGFPPKVKPEPTPEELLKAEARSVETVRAKLAALLKRKQDEEKSG